MTPAVRSAIAAVAWVLRSRVSAATNDCPDCVEAGVQYLSATSAALDVARNGAMALAEWIDDPVEVFRTALTHRRRYYGLRVADVDEAARAAGAAWTVAYGRRAA